MEARVQDVEGVGLLAVHARHRLHALLGLALEVARDLRVERQLEEPVSTSSRR
jgi:hypothetical protein